MEEGIYKFYANIYLTVILGSKDLPIFKVFDLKNLGGPTASNFFENLVLCLKVCLEQEPFDFSIELFKLLLSLKLDCHLQLSLAVMKYNLHFLVLSFKSYRQLKLQNKSLS